MGQQSTILGDVPHPPPQGNGIERGGVGFLDEDPSCIRVDQTIEAAEQRRFTRPAFADQHHGLAGPYVQ